MTAKWAAQIRILICVGYMRKNFLEYSSGAERNGSEGKNQRRKLTKIIGKIKNMIKGLNENDILLSLDRTNSPYKQGIEKLTTNIVACVVEYSMPQVNQFSKNIGNFVKHYGIRFSNKKTGEAFEVHYSSQGITLSHAQKYKGGKHYIGLLKNSTSKVIAINSKDLHAFQNNDLKSSVVFNKWKTRQYKLGKYDCIGFTNALMQAFTGTRPIKSTLQRDNLDSLVLFGRKHLLQKKLHQFNSSSEESDGRSMNTNEVNKSPPNDSDENNNNNNNNQYANDSNHVNTTFFDSQNYERILKVMQENDCGYSTAEEAYNNVHSTH